MQITEFLWNDVGQSPPSKNIEEGIVKTYIYVNMLNFTQQEA